MKLKENNPADAGKSSKRITSPEAVKVENKEIDLLKNQLARALADYDNLRKRTESEREVWVKFAAQNLLTRLLPVLDILESAQVHLKDQGLAITIGQFKDVLKEEDLEEISPVKGDHFNPKIHEAVESISGGKHGQVAETILSGWKFTDGPVVRISKVKVYAENPPVGGKKEEELEKEIARGEYM